MNTQRAINMLKVIQRHLRTHKEYESAEDVNLLIDYVSKIQSRLDAAVEEACRAAQADPNASRSGMVLNNADSEPKDCAQSIELLQNFLSRVTHWQEGKPDRHDALQTAALLLDQTEWIEKGIVEWRTLALETQGKLNDMRADRDRYKAWHDDVMAQEPISVCTVKSGDLMMVVRPQPLKESE